MNTKIPLTHDIYDILQHQGWIPPHLTDTFPTDVSAWRIQDICTHTRDILTYIDTQHKAYGHTYRALISLLCPAFLYQNEHSTINLGIHHLRIPIRRTLLRNNTWYVDHTLIYEPHSSTWMDGTIFINTHRMNLVSNNRQAEYPHALVPGPSLKHIGAAAQSNVPLDGCQDIKRYMQNIQGIIEDPHSTVFSSYNDDAEIITFMLPTTSMIVIKAPNLHDHV